MATFSNEDILTSYANVLYSPVATALPDETTVVWNDSSGAFTNWTGWTLLGYTLEPAVISSGYDIFEVEVQQSTSPARRQKTGETFTIATTLGQFIGANLALAFDGTNTPTAAGASQKAFDDVVFGGSTTLSEYQFAIEGYRLDSSNNEQPVRLFMYRATIRQDGDISFAKDAAVGVPVIIEGLLDSTKAVGAQMARWHIVTAPATS